MKIYLDFKAHINLKDLKKTDLNLIKNYLTISNPLFFKLGIISLPTWNVPERLSYYEIGADYISIPLGGAQNLKSVINTKNLQIIDNRFENPKNFKINFTGKLRNYQKTAVNKFMSRTIGTLLATTGSGKTIIAIAIICKRKQKTLFLVHTLELVNQFKERLLQFTDIKEENIGTIGYGKYEIRDISIGLLQTITKLPDTKINEINNHFGQIFVDECHICPANTFYSALNKLKAKYRYGLSATPFRADGLTKVIFFVTGNIFYTITPKEAKEFLIIPEVKYIETDYFFPIFDSTEHAILLSDMALDEKRNKLIIDTYKKEGTDKQSVFISHRTSQLEYLKTKIPESAILTSKVKKKERAQIIKDLNSKKLMAVLTTYGLFSTGIDIPSLEVIYMCTPIRSPRWIIQTAGRLKRKAKDKTKAIVIDFVDNKIELLKKQYYSRKSTWKKIRNEKI